MQSMFSFMRVQTLDKTPSLSTILINSSLGVVAQLVRVPPCHGGCRGFESRQPRMIFYQITLKQFSFFCFQYCNALSEILRTRYRGRSDLASARDEVSTRRGFFAYTFRKEKEAPSHIRKEADVGITTASLSRTWYAKAIPLESHSPSRICFFFLSRRCSYVQTFDTFFSDIIDRQGYAQGHLTGTRK